MKNLFFLIFMFLLTNSIIAQDKEVIDKVIGTVGGEVILLSDIEEQFTLLEQQRGSLEDEYRCVVLENLIAQKLLLNQAKLDSIEVTDEEVSAQLDARIEQILAYMNNDVSQFEAYYGQTVAEVKEDFREDLLNQLLIQRMQTSIIDNATVTPSEVKSFFARIPTDSLPYFNSEVEISEILYKPKVNATQKKIALDKITELRQQIVDGQEDFAALATKYSDDPGSARIGGDLGWQRRGTFVPEFEAAAYNLAANEISEVIETEFGFHILQLLERRGNSVHVRHILIKPEITYEDRQLAIATLDSVRHLIMIDSLKFSRAVKKFSDEKQQSFNNDGALLSPQSGSTFFEVGELDPEVYFTIDTMEVGTLSAPVEYQVPGSDVAYRIILLKSRTEPHKANLRQDYSKIKQATLEEKKNQFISEWVMEKIESTFINFDQSYQKCPNLQNWLSLKP